ncbi:MAG: MucR family transcriptional regulator [Gluconacetobacter sp.]
MLEDEVSKIPEAIFSKDEGKLTEAELSRLTSQIISAYVAHNHIQPDDLVSLLKDIRSNLKGEEAPAPVVVPVTVEGPSKPLTPAVPVNQSVHHDYLVCLEDGKQMTMLKRYLMTNYGLTPEAYKEKWGLPRDYPMSAPGYSESRSKLAKDLGLGRKPKGNPEQEATSGTLEPIDEPTATFNPKTRGRKKAAAQ